VTALDDTFVEVVILPRRRLRGDGGAVHLPGDVVRLDADTADVLAARGMVRYAMNPETVTAVREDVARGRTGRRIAATEGDFSTLDPEDRDLSDPEQVARRAAARRVARATRKPRAK
jgi:hypothetical protein